MTQQLMPNIFKRLRDSKQVYMDFGKSQHIITYNPVLIKNKVNELQSVIKTKRQIVMHLNLDYTQCKQMQHQMTRKT